MISKFAPRAFAAPIRYNAARFNSPVMAQRVQQSRRNVTTDAASSHVEKSEVPTV